jgi:hypothetical protein
MTTYEGMLNGKGMKFALVVGRFNELISSRLYEGALACGGTTSPTATWTPPGCRAPSRCRWWRKGWPPAASTTP